MKYKNKECGYIVDVFHCDYDKTIPNWMEKKIEDGSIIVKTEAQKAIYFFKTKYGVNVESIEGSWITYDGEFLMLYSQDGFFDLFSAVSLPNNYLRYSCDVVKPIPISKEGDTNCIRTIAKKLLDEFKDYVKNMTLEEFMEGLEIRQR